LSFHAHFDFPIILIDGEQLANLMIDFDLAVSTTHTFTIKRIDNDYFGDD
jgi:restriction system protein